MTLNSSVSFLCAIISWALAVFLTTQLLSGTFDQRTCQTACVSMVFWISFAIAIVGLIFSIGAVSIGKSNVIKTLSLLAVIVLCGIYTTVILIGTFGI